MRPRVLPLLLAAALSAVLVGCTGDSDAPPGADSKVVTLPENLCDRVLAVVSPDWQLAESDHDSSSTDDQATASCTLEGDRQGAVDLTATVTAFGSTDDAKAALSDDCDDLASAASGSFDHRDDGCDGAHSGPGDLSGFYALPSDQAVLELTMTHTGPFESAVAPELAQVSLALVAEPLGS